MRRLAWSALAALCVLAQSGASADAGQLVVVSDSDAIGFKRGTVLDDGATIKVPAGSRLVLIDSGGHGVTIRGPFDGGVHAATPAAPEDRSVLTAVQNILEGPTRNSVGAVRDAGDDVHPADARYVDLTRSGTDCVAQDRPIELWRPPPDKRTTLFLTRLSTGEHAEVDWPSGTATMTWPSDVRAVDGEAYQVSLQGTLNKSRVVLRFVTYGSSSIETAKRLADLDCRGQAVTMLQAIADPENR
jgi:hypothetical protein